MFITLGNLRTVGMFRIEIQRMVMTDNTTTEVQNIESYVHDANTSQYGLQGGIIRYEIHDSLAIVKSVKVYRYAVNSQTVKDMGVYKDPDNADYIFQTEFYNNYYKYFLTPDFNITNDINACFVSYK